MTNVNCAGEGEGEWRTLRDCLAVVRSAARLWCPKSRAGIPTVTGVGSSVCPALALSRVDVVDRARLPVCARVSIRFALVELARWWG